MPHRPAAGRRTAKVRLTALIFVLVLAVVLIAVGIYGLVRGPGTSPTPHESRPTASATAASRAPAPTPTVPALPVTANAKIFALDSALALFDWDTTTGLDVTDYEHPLIADADPTGQNTPGLLTDLTGYFPTEDEWDQLRDYQTRQWLTITSLTIPGSWGEAVRASHGQIHDGVIGYTITGTRHRAGVWTGKPITSSEKVAFTVFLACPPETKHCAVLRLSELNNPLH